MWVPCGDWWQFCFIGQTFKVLLACLVFCIVLMSHLKSRRAGDKLLKYRVRCSVRLSRVSVELLTLIQNWTLWNLDHTAFFHKASFIRAGGRPGVDPEPLYIDTYSRGIVQATGVSQTEREVGDSTYKQKMLIWMFIEVLQDTPTYLECEFSC